MSNTPLEQNGIDLTEVLEKVNALPSGGGITPSGSVTLTEERSYDVTEKATAIVDFSATRANLAEAVTAKGVDTLPTSSFDTIATNIGLISGGGGLPSNIQYESIVPNTDVKSLRFSTTFSAVQNAIITSNLQNVDVRSVNAVKYGIWEYDETRPTVFVQNLGIFVVKNGTLDYWGSSFSVEIEGDEIVITCVGSSSGYFVSGVTYQFVFAEYIAQL